MRRAFVLGTLALCGFTLAAETLAPDAGRKIEQRSCVQCHSLRLIHSQRLSSAAWQKEIKKMVGWGATVADEQTLLEYLAQEYSDTKAVPDPPLSVTADESRRVR